MKKATKVVAYWLFLGLASWGAYSIMPKGLYIFLGGMFWGILITLSVGGWIIDRRYEIKPKLEYRWACTFDGCNFSVGGTTHEGVLLVSDRHERSHTLNESY